MNKTLVALLIGLTVGTAALAAAQDEIAAEFTPTWSAFPTSQVYYPTRALERGRDGSAVLCCSAIEDGSLTCRIENEAPLGWHFGQAAMRITRSMRLDADSARTLAASEREMQLTVVFRVLEDRRARRRNGSWQAAPTGFCAAPPLA